MTAQKQSVVIAVRKQLIDKFSDIFDMEPSGEELSAIVDWLFSQDAIADSYFDEVGAA